VQGMITCIQEMTHYIRTAFGDSETGYGPDALKHALQGLLQGSGAAPPGWSAISAVLVQVMKEMGFGYSAWSMISKRAINLVCYAFVDDTDLEVTPKSPDEPTATLIQRAQQALSTWEGILRATGGALHEDKSYWYLVEVVRQNGTWQFKDQSNTPGSLFLHNNGDPKEAKRLEVSEAAETLGIQKAPNGDSEAEVEYLLQKVQKWADKVTGKKYSKYELWYALQSTIMKTLEYPLPALCLTKAECDRIMAPLLKTALPRCGIQSRIPHKLLYGSHRSQGFGLPDLFVVQLIEHLQVIQRHGCRDTPTGDNLVENMELVQTHIGSGTPFWELPFETHGHLAPDGWVKFTWECLDKFPLELRGPLKTVPKQRDQDHSENKTTTSWMPSSFMVLMNPSWLPSTTAASGSKPPCFLIYVQLMALQSPWMPGKANAVPDICIRTLLTPEPTNPVYMSGICGEMHSGTPSCNHMKPNANLSPHWVHGLQRKMTTGSGGSVPKRTNSTNAAPPTNGKYGGRYITIQLLPNSASTSNAHQITFPTPSIVPVS